MNSKPLSDCKHQNSPRKLWSWEQMFRKLVLWRSTDDCEDEYILESCHASRFVLYYIEVMLAELNVG